MIEKEKGSKFRFYIFFDTPNFIPIIGRNLRTSIFCYMVYIVNPILPNFSFLYLSLFFVRTGVAYVAPVTKIEINKCN